MTRVYYAREAKTRYVRRPDCPLPAGRHFSTPRDTAAFLIPLLAPEVVEVGVVLTLDVKHRLIAFHEISRGTLDSTAFHPREVFAAAFADRAAAVIIAHNHPSGDPTPSRDDCALLERLRQIADLIGIDLLDSIIIGDNRYFSFRESGR
jgi:DNA repair protein RadC